MSDTAMVVLIICITLIALSIISSHNRNRKDR
nr:MAG TPA: chitin synthase regulator [Caudoviricetes sp.]